VRLYRIGDSGEPVRDIQDRLGASGFDCAPDESGEFDGATRAAVTAFQRSRSLDADGIVGPETWRALVEAAHELGDRLLYHRLPMLRGEDVAELQRRLNALGFDTGKVDGIFGPDTLDALLDFQRNRNMAEDGIAGRRVARELALLDRETRKEGREGVRERQWLRDRPASVAGMRIYVDAFNRDSDEAAAWQAAVAAAGAFQNMGAHPWLSRTADTAPPERVRARRANRRGVDLVVAFSLPRGDAPAVHYFASRHARSEAGVLLADAVAGRLDVSIDGRATPMLRETRSPAVVVAVEPLEPWIGEKTAAAVGRFFALDEQRVS
jgi:N-acetylmuramoyl-L-alanine amidase